MPRLVDVTKFVVQVAFESAGSVEDPMRRTQVDPLRASWGPGHLYSLLGLTDRGRQELVVCAVVAARSLDEGCQMVMDRAGDQVVRWLGGSSRPRSIRAQRVCFWRRAGRFGSVPRAGDEGLSGDPVPRRPMPAPAHLKAASALTRPQWPGARGPG